MADPSTPAPAPRSLLPLPFALLGLLGGWLTSRLVHNGAQEIRGLLVIMTTVASAGLGRALPPRGGKGPLAAIARAVASIVLAGLINGVLIGFFGGGLLGIMVGGLFGLIFAAPFVPALLPVIAAARRVGRARAGSLVDGADRRAVWLATAMVAALASLLPVVAGREEDRARSYFPLLSGWFEGDLAISIPISAA